MSSIAFIDLPLRGTNKSDGHDVMVVALVANDTLAAAVQAVYVNDDGDLKQAPIEAININWRFDDRRRKWADVDTGEDLGGDDDPEG